MLCSEVYRNVLDTLTLQQIALVFLKGPGTPGDHLVGHRKEGRLSYSLGSGLNGGAYLEVEIKGSHHVHPFRKALQGRRGESHQQSLSHCQKSPTPSALTPAQNSQGLSLPPLPVTFFFL